MFAAANLAINFLVFYLQTIQH